MNVSKKELIARIQNRFGGALPRREIADAVAALLELIEEELISGRAVSVPNFGTLSPYLYPARRALDVTSGKIRVTKAFRSVRFHPHIVFREIVELRLKPRKEKVYEPPQRKG